MQNHHPDRLWILFPAQFDFPAFFPVSGTRLVELARWLDVRVTAKLLIFLVLLTCSSIAQLVEHRTVNP